MTLLYTNLGIAEYINRQLSNMMYTCQMRVFLTHITTQLDNLTIRNSILTSNTMRMLRKTANYVTAIHLLIQKVY